MKNKKLAAFTLAEVLITLAIIGVVAALTIPTVITNYQRKMYVTQLKKSYNNITNGLKTYMAQEGVTKLSDTSLWANITDESISADELLSTGNEAFKDEFLKVFKVSAIYDENNYPEAQTLHYKNLNGEAIGDINYGIFLADGSYIYFYFRKGSSPAYCKGKLCSSLKDFQEKRNTSTTLWEEVGSISIDVNGAKGPNTAGRDLFQFVVGNDGTLYPSGGLDEALYSGSSSSTCGLDDLEACNDYWKNNNNLNCDPSMDGYGCAARIMENGWEMDY